MFLSIKKKIKVHVFSIASCDCCPFANFISFISTVALSEIANFILFILTVALLEIADFILFIFSSFTGGQ